MPFEEERLWERPPMADDACMASREVRKRAAETLFATKTPSRLYDVRMACGGALQESRKSLTRLERAPSNRPPLS